MVDDSGDDVEDDNNYNDDDDDETPLYFIKKFNQKLKPILLQTLAITGPVKQK